MAENNDKKSTTAEKASKQKSEVVPAKTETKSSAQAVTIAILSTVIVCIIVVFGALLAAGVIKFGGNENGLAPLGDDPVQIKTDAKDKKTSGSDGKIIDNPNKKVAVKNSTPVVVKDLTFYLPDEFKAGGKNNDGAYTYNLVDDEGWAQVLVYNEKSNLTPEKYLMKISPYLDITDTDYKMNGTSWVQGENESAIAYATELDGKIYAIYYSVKLDSDATGEAMQMIPKTLYMNKIYSE